MLSDVISLAPSLCPHILLHSFHSPFCFLPSFCSVSFLFCVVAHNLFCLFLISYILLFGLFMFFLGFPISCVLTISPHFPSSHPSGPETPSFPVHHPLPPPKVLTPQHTALCAAVHTLSLRRGLIAKVCLSPWWCLSWCVCGGWFGVVVGS